MNLKLFHERYGNNEDWTTAEHESIIRMLHGYEESGNQVCHDNDHVFDELLSWIIERYELLHIKNMNDISDEMRAAVELMKKCMDIGIGIGIDIAIEKGDINE